jgi:hypothetical protein
MRSPADHLCLRRHRGAAGQREAVLAGDLEVPAPQPADGKPVVVRTVAAEQGGARARDRHRPGPDDVVVPAGDRALLDTDNRESGVVAGPGGDAVDVERVAVADGAERPVRGRVIPGRAQVRGEARQPAAAHRLRSWMAPALVPGHAFVGVPDPDVTGPVGEDVLDPVAEHLLGHLLAAGVVDHRVGVRAVPAPPAPGSHEQDRSPGQRLDREVGEPQPGNGRHRYEIRGV